MLLNYHTKVAMCSQECYKLLILRNKLEEHWITLC